MVGFVSKNKKGGKIQMTPGVPDGPDPPDGAGAPRVHLDGGASIMSSPGGQDQAIDTPTTLLPVLEVQKSGGYYDYVI